MVIIPEVKIIHEKVIEKLYQNYPNPFNLSTKIQFVTPASLNIFMKAGYSPCLIYFY